MSEVTTIVSHTGNQAPGDADHDLVYVFLWQLFQVVLGLISKRSLDLKFTAFHAIIGFIIFLIVWFIR